MMPAAPEQLQTALADRYVIERELGEGGMANVYLAQDVKHQRQVAVKVLKPELAAVIGHERFLREITTTAALRHPHILPLYDSGEAGGFLFYVMPYVEGETLRGRLKEEKQLPLDEALLIAREVADALSYAHSRGVIHRDVKPENILLEGGHAVVVDFGIARALDAAGGEQLTQTGLAVGTPLYMSPEQAVGERELDGRSDLYSLGCVLYEMLAGQPPFTGPTVESVIHQHVSVEPRAITELRPAVPATVAGVVQRALAKKPADRFNPVAQFADALRPEYVTGGARLGGGWSAAPARWSTLLIAVLLIALVAIVGMRLLGGRSGAAAGEGGTPSLAVLPFVDLSGGANEYLGDGMAETLINALSGVQGLRVAARTSAFSFKGRNEDVREIGEELGVDAVLEGSVQRSGDRLRITAQLINAEDGFHLWSQSFDRQMADVFAVQDEVAQAVVAALEVELVEPESHRVVEQGTESLAAYNAYLQGLFYWNKRTAADLERAAAFYHEAIAADSGFARAWAGLASAYVLFGPSNYNVESIAPGEALDRAEHAARRALQLDERLAGAHTALAFVLEKRGRMEEAGESHRQAVAFDPRYPTGRQWYALYLAKTGRMDEAVEQMRTAQRLDPLSLVIGAEIGEVLEAAGHTEEAAAQYERVLERYPETFLTYYFVGLHLLMEQDFERAAHLVAGYAIERGADSAEGRRIAAGIRDPATREATLRQIADTATYADVAAGMYRALGEDEAAVAAFERIVDGPFFDKIYLPHVLAVLGPELSSLPRTQAAIQRLFARLRERYGGA